MAGFRSSNDQVYLFALFLTPVTQSGLYSLAGSPKWWQRWSLAAADLSFQIGAICRKSFSIMALRESWLRMALSWSSLGHVHIPELCLDWPGWVTHVLPCSWGHGQGAGNNGISTRTHTPHTHTRTHVTHTHTHHTHVRTLPPNPAGSQPGKIIGHCRKGGTGTGQAEATVFR